MSNTTMTKFRVFFFLSTIVVVGIAGIFVSYYARGYRLNFKTFKFQPNGILVIKSEPDGASVIVNNELKTATNATLSLSPGTYDIKVSKDGFFSWSKRMVIEKEIVTQASASLFKNVPSLSPITFSGATNPVISNDGTKIAFIVLPSKDTTPDKVGLFTVDTYTLPLGFSTNPKRVTDGDLTNANYIFSPDGRQIMLTIPNGQTISNSIFVLDSGSFTSQNERINIAAKKETTLAQWQKEKDIKNASLTRSLPVNLVDILTRKTSNYTFSPDENMILYTASGAATLANNLIPQLPGASTQKQERDIQKGHTYIYDIKEDRNFLVEDKGEMVRWMPDSRHLILAQNSQVVIMDTDGTNRQVVYSGSYIAPNAFPYTNTTKVLILTNLGAASSSANLYSLTIK